MVDLQQTKGCVYCGAEAVIYDAHAFHPYVKQHGPFTLYQCRNCGSLFTDPVPSDAQLKSLYSGYDHGMYQKVAELRRKFPLMQWFEECLDTIRKFFPDPLASFTWIDLGAGEGYMSMLMKKHYPNSTGIAVDFHPCPEAMMHENTSWLTIDLNKQWVGLPQVDLVFSITVMEHVVSPEKFLESLLKVLKPGGVAYLNCPRTDAMAFRLMGKRWPYYLPGEHITIPSRLGLRKLLERLTGGQRQIQVEDVVMPYPLGYYLGYYLGLRASHYWFNPSIHIPTGLLACVVSGGVKS